VKGKLKRPDEVGIFLQASLFLAIRLFGSRTRSRKRRLTCGGILLLAGDRPPAPPILRQLAHLRAMFRARLVGAMAVAQRRCRPRQQCRRLVGECCSRNSSQQDCCANRLADPARSRIHVHILKRGRPKTDSATDGESLVSRVWTYWRRVPVPGSTATLSIHYACEGRRWQRNWGAWVYPWLRSGNWDSNGHESKGDGLLVRDAQLPGHRDITNKRANGTRPGLHTPRNRRPNHAPTGVASAKSASCSRRFPGFDA
jgi:hypothetical protein